MLAGTVIIEIVNKMQESERAMSTNLPVLYGTYSVLGHLLEGKRAAAEVGDTRPLVWWPSLCQGGIPIFLFIRCRREDLLVRVITLH